MMRKLIMFLLIGILTAMLCACDGNAIAQREKADATVAPAVEEVMDETPPPVPMETEETVTEPMPAPEASEDGEEPIEPLDSLLPVAELKVAQIDPMKNIYDRAMPFFRRQIVRDSRFQLGQMWDDGGGGTAAIDLGSYPHIDGSTVAIPMAEEFARQHLKLYFVNNFVAFNKTHQAYENLILGEQNSDEDVEESGVTVVDANMDVEDPLLDLTYLRDIAVEASNPDIIIVTEPSDDELQLAEDNGVELVAKPVCWDAFVFITYKENPVDSLTIEQVRNIYSGEITNWSAVGGEDIPISAFMRNENSGSQTAMENLVMQGAAFGKDILKNGQIGDMGTLIGSVGYSGDDGGGLGYTYKYYLDNLTDSFGEGGYFEQNVKALSIDGVAPDAENIVSQSYPFYTNYYGVIRKGDEGEKGGEFLDWMLSEEGQECILQAGYISLDGRCTATGTMFDADGFLFPDSSDRTLTDVDMDRLRNYTHELESYLGFARNEIFARHGNTFNNPTYADHYAQYDWYNDMEHHTVELEDLNTTEQANVKLIQKQEEELKQQ